MGDKSLVERDTEVLKLAQAGASYDAIAKRMSMTLPAVARTVSRALSRLNREALLAHPEMLRMELERLDRLQAALWPMTQPRTETIKHDDGTSETFTYPPDVEAVDRVLKIMERRAKMLGFDVLRQQVDVNVQGEIRSSLLGEEKDSSGPIDRASESRRLLELFEATGMVDSQVASGIRKALEAPEPIEATVVGEEE
jgi:hypothetical protein